MKDKREKQPGESEHVDRHAEGQENPQSKRMAVKNKPRGTDVNINLNISDILDVLPFYVLFIDQNHHILHANSAVRAQLGLEPKDIVGKYCPQVIHGLDTPWYACPLEEAVEKGRAVEREVFDEESGHWVRSAVYPTNGYTSAGRRIFFHMVFDITDRKQAEEQLKTSRKQLCELSRHLESIREEERKSVAREIHDELGQLLTGLKIDLSWMTRRLPERDSLFHKARSMHKLLDIAIHTVKMISAKLRPAVLDDLGLAAAIEWQGQEFEKRTEIKFELTSGPEDIVLDRDCSTAIFRIFQEALTNVIRHANATAVKVNLEQEDNEAVLRITDNGNGIAEKQVSDAQALGLVGMRERARYWGGEVIISGTPGMGTTVVVSIPLPNTENLNAKNTNR